MQAKDVLADGFGRIEGLVRRAVEGADDTALTRRLDPDANTLAWLTWHIAREQDGQIAPLAGTEQVWTSREWSTRFALPFDDSAIGYGHTSDEVAQVVAPAELLLGYLADATAASLAYVERLADDDLDVVVDESWDPPVTLGVRLVSVLGDAFEHAGQAAYLRGVLDRTAR
ncbi:MAG: DinB family protein [Cellulomonas sp.]|uniref:mycothiol transferase n=1 Tax=Cellulomonas sp. TaxID=40001 RepID=UPI00258B57D4|nr:DUF664 domain-containing protein [Cellulomonas sp.]MCR6704669.1 DinB family protein [Cellulomonas sp.]MCR6706604.1 DinB family protein [Cellulomonas sp.]